MAKKIELPKLESLDALLNKGKKRGLLTYNEIMDSLQDVDLDPDQIDRIYEALTEMGIEVVDEGEEEKEVSSDAHAEEELDITVPEGVAIDDPVRMYLKEIGRVPTDS